MLGAGSSLRQFCLSSAADVLGKIELFWDSKQGSVLTCGSKYQYVNGSGDSSSTNPYIWRTTLMYSISGLLWSDTTWAALYRADGLLADYINGFSQVQLVSLTQVCGCEDWILEAVAKVNELDAWKRSLAQENRLSMVDLLQTAEPIKQYLSALLGDLESQRTSSPSLAMKPTGPPSVNQPLKSKVGSITEIYASATLTYLHIIVSGPLPRVEDISTGVRRTTTLLRKVSRSPSLMRSLKWPVCITGCMAVDAAQRGFYRDIARYDEGEAIIESLNDPVRILQVMEHCWKSFDADNSCVQDWTSASATITKIRWCGTVIEMTLYSNKKIVPEI